ncbi:MAG: hypothetical protein ABI629_20320, partial [bacterium]
DGTGFAIPGEVDSFAISMAAGESATILKNYTEKPGQPNMRLFDPDGKILNTDVCTGQVTFTAAKTGTYTALISPCQYTPTYLYRLVLSKGDCAQGPVITTFGVTTLLDPQLPIGLDEAGRPIFYKEFGQDFFVILEARAGAGTNRFNPGPFSAPYGDGEAPDMQMIVSRPLGDGSPVVCDISPPDFGGVPATVPFQFSDAGIPQDIVHDMGCRFADGAGNFQAVQSDDTACTRSNRTTFGFGFADRSSRLQFCGRIVSAWAFPDGDTIVAARVKDQQNREFGAVREIVVRVGDPNPPTQSPTPSATPSPTRIPTSTATRTRTPAPTATATKPSVLVTATATRTRPPTKTRTPTRTPGGTETVGPSCAGDCGGDGRVTIADLTTVINIALGNLVLEDCPAADSNASGEIEIADVIAAVNSALNGCT